MVGDFSKVGREVIYWTRKGALVKKSSDAHKIKYMTALKSNRKDK